MKLIPYFASSLLLLMGHLQAQLAYNLPEGGWDYFYQGDESQPSPPSEDFPALDGHWSHSNSSDAWDGSEIGGDFGDDNRPGGISVLSDAADLGEVPVFIRIQDPGDPRDHGFSDYPSNRMIYLTRTLTDIGASDNLLDEGVTLIFRARVPTDGPLDPLHPDGQDTTEPYPKEGDGYLTSNGGKGHIVLRQASGGAISFCLTTAADTTNGAVSGLSFNELIGNQIIENVNYGDGEERNYLSLDPTEWHEFWITIESDASAAGTHVATIYRDGKLTAESFPLTAGNGSDRGDTYLAIGSASTQQSYRFGSGLYRRENSKPSTRLAP